MSVTPCPPPPPTPSRGPAAFVQCVIIGAALATGALAHREMTRHHRHMRVLPAFLDPCLPPSWRSQPKRTVLQYRMDELAKAFAAVHLAVDVLDDERQIAKLKKAEKLTKDVHAEVHPEGSFFRNLLRADSGGSDAAPH